MTIVQKSFKVICLEKAIVWDPILKHEWGNVLKEI